MLLAHIHTAAEATPLAPARDANDNKPRAPPRPRLRTTFLLVAAATALAILLIIVPLPLFRSHRSFPVVPVVPALPAFPPTAVHPAPPYDALQLVQPASQLDTLPIHPSSDVPRPLLFTSSPSSYRALQSAQRPLVHPLPASQTAHLFFSWSRQCPSDHKPTTHLVGACTETCGASTSISSYLKCRKTHPQGCHFRTCKNNSWKRHCTFTPDKLDRPSLCPGDALRISAAPLRSLSEVPLSVTLGVRHPGSPPARTDVVFLLSATASMRIATTKLSASMMSVLQTFSSAVQRRDHAFGLAVFRDEYYGKSAFLPLQRVTTRRAAVAAAAKRIVALGGGDACDANLPALAAVATDPRVGWRDGADTRRVVVYIADHPGHEPSCNRASKPPVTRDSVIKQLNKARIEVLAVDLGAIDGPPTPFACDSKGAKPVRGGQASAIAAATGGRVVVQRDQNDVVAALNKVAGMLSFTSGVAVRDSMCAGVVDIAYDPELPVGDVWGSALKVKMDVSVRKSICTLGGTFRCDVEFVSGPASLGKISIDVTDVIGCNNGK